MHPASPGHPSAELLQRHKAMAPCQRAARHASQQGQKTGLFGIWIIRNIQMFVNVANSTTVHFNLPFFWAGVLVKAVEALN